MKIKKNFTLLGGDIRQDYLLATLQRQGYSCHNAIRCTDTENTLLFDMIHNSDFILGPIPFAQDNKIKGSLFMPLSGFEAYLHEGQHVFGGNIPETLVENLRKSNITCHDYMKNEEIAIFNSIATAEGLIADIITSFPSNLYMSRVLILGYGRCAKTLADRLQGLGCNVTICARNETALALAYSLGSKTLPLEDFAANAVNFDLIINTIPAHIITKEVLSTLTPATYLYDIASKPGGIDYDMAAFLGLHASLHLSLPGKYAPKISAEALHSFILRELKDLI